MFAYQENLPPQPSLHLSIFYYLDGDYLNKVYLFFGNCENWFQGFSKTS